VVITNLPRVQENRYEKLIKVVTKLVSKIGTLQSTEEFSGVFMPMHEGGTKGFCFVEYETQEDAKKAVEVLQGYKFDKNHELTVTLYERARKLEFIDTSIFREPEPAAFEEKPNAMEWLEDPNQRDEFMVRYNKETVVYWYDAKNDPAVDYDGSREKDAGVAWCEYYCHWSPAGSYLATLVPPKGVILWSGRNYDKVGRFVARKLNRIVYFYNYAQMFG
jgi:translation initiation factor 3 subunit B